MASSSSNYGAMNAMEENIVSGVGVDENISLLNETNAEASKAANMSSGGGGGGAAGGDQDSAIIAGGGGAPLGIFHPNKSFQPHTNPTEATILNFGEGGKINTFNDNWWLGGNGGALGEAGAPGNHGSGTWLNGGEAGLIYEGNVTITNVEAGQTKGKLQ